MSRSRRKAPICPLAGNRGVTSNHQWQRKERRRYRRDSKVALRFDKEIPSWKQYCNEWASPRDGKTLWKGYCGGRVIIYDERSGRK